MALVSFIIGFIFYLPLYAANFIITCNAQIKAWCFTIALNVLLEVLLLTLLGTFCIMMCCISREGL